MPLANWKARGVCILLVTIMSLLLASHLPGVSVCGDIPFVFTNIRVSLGLRRNEGFIQREYQCCEL